MSMTTTLKLLKTGKVHKFITQQYQVGLYVAVYTEGEPIPKQCGSELSELEYHRSLREIAKKDKDFEFIKDESDALNRKEVRDAQVAFAVSYCKKKHWPVNVKDEYDYFRKLTDKQVTEIRKQKGFTACLSKLEW